MADRAPRNPRARRAAVLAASLALLVCTVPALADGEARVTIKVEDANGDGVAGVEVTFEPAPGNDYRVRTVRTNKKGSASMPNLSPAKYTPRIDADTWAIVTVSFDARRSDGVRLAQFAEEDVATNGTPTIDFPAFSRGTLTLVVADRAAKPAGDPAGGIAGASDPTGRLKIANAMFDTGKWTELLAETESLLAESPELGEASYLRAIALWKTESMDASSEAFEQALRHAPDQPGIHGVYAAQLIEAAREGRKKDGPARFARAVELIEAQLERTPGARDQLVNLVIALEGADRNEDAVAALDRLIAADPSDARAHARKVDLLLQLGRPEAALEALRSSPAPAAEKRDFLYNTGVQLFNAGEYDAAIAAMREVIREDPGMPGAHRVLGRSLLSSGDTQGAAESLNKFLELAPADDPDRAPEEAIVKAIEAQGG